MHKKFLMIVAAGAAASAMLVASLPAEAACGGRGQPPCMPSSVFTNTKPALATQAKPLINTNRPGVQLGNQGGRLITNDGAGIVATGGGNFRR